MNAEQIDEKGNWAASNPAYELFCIQAEVHHQRMEAGRSPSPDNTDAQMPDMPSEVAMDGDNDSLVNVNFVFVRFTTVWRCTVPDCNFVRPSIE